MLLFPFYLVVKSKMFFFHLNIVCTSVKYDDYVLTLITYDIINRIISYHILPHPPTHTTPLSAFGDNNNNSKNDDINTLPVKLASLLF